MYSHSILFLTHQANSIIFKVPNKICVWRKKSDIQFLYVANYGKLIQSKPKLSFEGKNQTYIFCFVFYPYRGQTCSFKKRNHVYNFSIHQTIRLTDMLVYRKLHQKYSDLYIYYLDYFCWLSGCLRVKLIYQPRNPTQTLSAPFP